MAKPKKTDEAVELLTAHLSRLEHPKGKILRLVNYDGPGSDRLRRDLAEAIMELLRTHGHAPGVEKKSGHR